MRSPAQPTANSHGAAPAPGKRLRASLPRRSEMSRASSRLSNRVHDSNGQGGLAFTGMEPRIAMLELEGQEAGSWITLALSPMMSDFLLSFHLRSHIHSAFKPPGHAQPSPPGRSHAMASLLAHQRLTSACSSSCRPAPGRARPLRCRVLRMDGDHCMLAARRRSCAHPCMLAASRRAFTAVRASVTADKASLDISKVRTPSEELAPWPVAHGCAAWGAILPELLGRRLFAHRTPALLVPQMAPIHDRILIKPLVDEAVCACRLARVYLGGGGSGTV